MSLKNIWQGRSQSRWHEPTKPPAIEKHWRVTDWEVCATGELPYNQAELVTGVPACSIENLYTVHEHKLYNYDFKFMCKRCFELYRRHALTKPFVTAPRE